VFASKLLQKLLYFNFYAAFAFSAAHIASCAYQLQYVALNSSISSILLRKGGSESGLAGAGAAEPGAESMTDAERLKEKRSFNS